MSDINKNQPCSVCGADDCHAHVNENPHYGRSAGLCHDRFFVPKEILALIKPCPFCGEQPEVRECPDASSSGYFVRCPELCAETSLRSTVEDAVAAWNTRASRRWFDALCHNPAVLYGSGALLLASGAGLDRGFPLFLVFSGTSLMFYQLAAFQGCFSKPVDRDRIELALESSRTVRTSSCPGAPSCPLCGSHPVLHETAGGRFYVLCSNAGCPALTKLQPSQHSAEESLRVWKDEYVPEFQRRSGAEKEQPFQEI